MHFDDILRILGEFGPYQRRLYIILCIPMISAGFHMVISVFLTGTPNHRCAIPGYDNDTYAEQSDYHRYLINATIPPSSDETITYEQCKIYDVNISDPASFVNATTTPCTAWVYDKSIFISTFTAQINLVCDDKMKTSHAQMIFFGGVLVGSIGLGALSDAFGRKKVLYFSFILNLVSTFAVAWVPNFAAFCVLRFLVGVSCLGMFMTAFVMGMELVGPSKRVIAGVVIEFFWAAGLIILAGIGYAFKHWQYIEIACSVPAVFYLIYWWLIPESARWLVSKNKYEEAEKILVKAAKVNKVVLPKNIIDSDSNYDPSTGKIWHMFTSRVLLVRTLVIFFNWMVVSMVFYGLSLNTGNLGGDFYLNFFLQAVVELPAYALCLVLLNKTGRKILHCSTMILGGLCCICTIFTMLYADESLQPITVTLAMLGKIGIAAAFAIIYVWSAELFPTVVRNAGMGASSSCARVGGMISPYIADISKVVPGNFGRALPLVIFGGLAVVAGIIAIMLPETLGQNLPETIEDGRQFGKSDSLTNINKKKEDEFVGGEKFNPVFMTKL